MQAKTITIIMIVVVLFISSMFVMHMSTLAGEKSTDDLCVLVIYMQTDGELLAKCEQRAINK